MEVADSTEQLMRPTHHKTESFVQCLAVEELGILLPLGFMMEEINHANCITMVTDRRIGKEPECIKHALNHITHIHTNINKCKYRLLNEEEVEIQFIDPRRKAPRAINRISTDTEFNNRLTQRGRGRLL